MILNSGIGHSLRALCDLLFQIFVFQAFVTKPDLPHSQILIVPMRRLMLPLLMLAALSVMLSASATNCQAGILVPQPVGFDDSDLEKALDAGPSTSAGTTNSGTTTTTSSSSSSRRTSHEWPPSDSDQPSNPLELVKSLPTSNSSSSTSTSSAGGAVGSGVVLCAFNNTLTLRDDSPLGSLAEDHGFSLPEPPGTDLLRPPRG